LLRRKSTFLEPRPYSLGWLAVIFEVIRGELCGRRVLSFHDGVDFTPKAGTAFEEIFNLYACVADSRAPSDTWIGGRGCLELEQMAENPPDLRIELGPLRIPQAFYLLR
jgi:hypothetical protein